MAEFNPILVASLTKLYNDSNYPETYHNDELLNNLLQKGAITEEDRINIINNKQKREI